MSISEEENNMQSDAAIRIASVVSIAVAYEVLGKEKTRSLANHCVDDLMQEVKAGYLKMLAVHAGSDDKVREIQELRSRHLSVLEDMRPGS